MIGPLLRPFAHYLSDFIVKLPTGMICPVICLLALFPLVLLAEEKPAADQNTKSLFDGKTTKGWKLTKFGGDGKVAVENGELILGMGEPLTGVTIADGKGLPTDNFEIHLDAKRVMGEDFFCGLTFPCHDGHCSLICGGWGGGVVGISSFNGMDASENETTKYMKFESNKWYHVRVRVAEGKLQTWIDDKPMADVELKGKKIDTRIEVDVSKPLGIATYRTKAALKNIELRKIVEKK